MAQEDFIDEYISTSISEGIKTVPAITTKALAEIKDIEEILKRDNELRIKKSNLQRLIKSLKRDDLLNSLSNSEIELEANNSITINAIKNIILESNDPVFPKDIVDRLMVSDDLYHIAMPEDKQRQVYLSIKWLTDNNILERLQNRSLIKGKAWTYQY
jgi:hypothetical protein